MPIIFWLADDFLNLVINERSSFEAPLKEHKDEPDARNPARFQQPLRSASVVCSWPTKPKGPPVS